MKSMNLFCAAFAALSVVMFAQTSLEAKVDAKKVPGTYISEAFSTTGSNGAFSDIRNELLVLHSDGTAARYISSAIGSFFANENSNGVELTPSYGTWEVDGDTVKAVFFDFFNLAPCTPKDKCAAAQVIAIEYDRFTYTIKFCNDEDKKYQKALANEYLLGFVLSTCQDPNNPTAPNFPCLDDLKTYNDPFLALKSFNYLISHNTVDPSTLFNKKPLLRSNIIFHRVNVKKDFLFPPSP